MKKLWTVLALFVFIIPLQAQNDFTGQFWFNQHIQLSYSPEIADNARWSFSPITETSPEWTGVIFENYDEATSWAETGGYIAVGLVRTFPTNQTPLAIYELFMSENLSNGLSDNYQPWNPKTTVPVTNFSQARYLSTESVDGVRFVIQDDTNESIYIFDGVTIDEEYAVAAYIPLGDFSSEPNPTNQIDELIESLVIQLPETVTLLASTNGIAEFEDIQFSYPPDLVYRVQADFTPEFLGEDAPIPGGYTVHPDWHTFTLVSQQPSMHPTITVADIANFADTESFFQAGLNDLQDLLVTPTNLAERARTVMTLPVLNASRVIVLHADYVENEHLKGIRFITHISQEASPLIATSFQYIFIGLDIDGTSLVGARFPLYLGTLPDDFPTDIDWTEFSKNYGNYIEEMTLAIEALPYDAFEPSIDIVDEIIKSIEVK